MKKTLIALAVLAASGASFAQSTVTLSGGFGLAAGTTTIGEASSGMQIARQTGNINFAGTEDLGGGLKASFQLQTSIGSIATTNGAAAPATLGDRGANVNLMGSFGTLSLGRSASAVRALWGSIGDVSQLPVVSGLSAGNTAAAATAPVAIAAGDAQARVIYGDAYANSISYSSPSLNGFTVSVGVAPSQSTTTNVGDDAATKDTVSYTLGYANGPLAAAVNLTDMAATAAGGAKMTTVLVSYDLGLAKVGLTQQSINLNAGGVNPGDAYAVTAAVPVGAGLLSFGFGNRKEAASTDTTYGDGVAQQFVGYRYNLSKRTNMSLVWNKIDRTGTATDVKETHLVVGHTF